MYFEFANTYYTNSNVFDDSHDLYILPVIGHIASNILQRLLLVKGVRSYCILKAVWNNCSTYFKGKGKRLSVGLPDCNTLFFLKHF